MGQRPHPSTPRFSSWVVYWDEEDSLRALAEQSNFLEEVAIFAYHFNDSCRTVPATRLVVEATQALRQLPEGHHPRVLVTVVNDAVGAEGTSGKLKDPDCVHRLLAPPEAIARHIEELLELSAEADGIEIDYENLWLRDREAFSRFVQELAARVHERGQWLSVVVQPKIRDEWGDGAGAIDWKLVAHYADRVKVMAYHYHHAKGKPGPLTSPTWVSALARFSLHHIPRDKLSIVLTLHGFDWPEGAPGVSIEHATALALAAAHHTHIRRDRQSGSAYFSYTDDRGVRHQVWFEDAVSVKDKVDLLRRRGVLNIGLWRLGTGDMRVWETIQSLSEGP